MAIAFLIAPTGATATPTSGGASPDAGEGSDSDRSTSRRGSDDDGGGGDNSRSDPYDGPRARVVNGKAIPPKGAPREVKEFIEATNQIVTKGYRYGGGHAKIEDSGYDCSGTISYGLIEAGLLKSPLASGPFMNWGGSGAGEWITIYANSGHAFAVVAGLRLDTGYRTDAVKRWGGKSGKGPRWDAPRSTSGFVARHPSGY